MKQFDSGLNSMINSFDSKERKTWGVSIE